MDKLKKIIKVLLCFVILTCILVSGKSSSAATSQNVEIQFVFTTDLHGRLTTTDFEQNKSFDTGSLAKAYQLIKNARNEKLEGNTFTFDIGDVLYDYTTETIYDMKPEIVQPIYKAMATMNYDAIVLGNHEFEYGYDYLMQQMNNSGLKDICVVSNLYDDKTGKTAFHENMMLTRKVKTNSGQTATIKIGVIGETVPVLSKKREDYTGIFSTEDIVANTEKEAKILKAKGADVILVLAHSGFGTENPVEMSDDASYALTKIKDVDVVLCGHEHKMFPSNSVNSEKFYSLPGVDKKTGLVNGKNLVMANDIGQSIGVVNLTLSETNSKFKIVDRSSEVRLVDSSTSVNEELNKGYDEWKNIFTTNKKTVVGNVAAGKSITNYMGLIEDTSGIQLLNNAMIRFALQYVNSSGKQYKNEPIIAASSYSQYGQFSGDDFVNINGQMTESVLSSIVSSHRYLHLYEITGKQLKEWMEWSASAYQTTGKNVAWTDETMKSMMNLTNAKSLVSEDWLDSWCYFYVFDGIEYAINPSVEPRYSYYGKLINNTNRISNVTCNGVPVTDNMKVVMATQSLTGLSFDAWKGITDSVIRKGNNNRLSVLEDYVKDLCQVEDLVPSIDHNWNISLPSGTDFILKLSEKAFFGIQDRNWIPTKIETVNQYTYYNAKYQLLSEDLDAPNLVIASTNEVETNQDVTIAVNATDSSGIKVLKFLNGNYAADSFIWDNAAIIDNNTFSVSYNGIYTVYAEDNNGKKVVSKISISNINREILQIPKVNSYSNRMSKITGTAEVGAEVYFVTEDGIFHNAVEADGRFSCQLPMQQARDVVSVYVQDKYGRRSDTVTVVVKRTGPNYPEMNTINNNDIKISGSLNDNSVKAVFAVVKNKVYVSSVGGTTAYKKCEKYNEDLNIVKTKASVRSDGSFSLAIPALRSSTSVSLYTIDYAGRVSKANTCKVTYAAPNAPTIYTVCNAENQIQGMVYSAVPGNTYSVTVSVDGINYQTVTDENGYFTVMAEDLQAGQDISVYATELVDNIVRKSAIIKSKVKNVQDYVTNNEYISVNQVTDKSGSITGACEYSNVQVTLKVDNSVYQVTTNAVGDFDLPLTGRLKKGTMISAVIRREHGGIVDADVGAVVLGKPYKPVLVTPEIYNTTRSLTVASTEKVRITIRVGTEIYTSKDYYFDDSLNSYLFDFKINNVNSGSEMSIYATNSAGNSSQLKLQVLQKAPDTPKTKIITTKSKVIQGTVSLLLENTSDDNQTPTVKNTKTKVYAKIGKKIYTAVINDDGTFTIKIPAQKAKTSIKIWAENAQGKGPAKLIKVKQVK